VQGGPLGLEMDVSTSGSVEDILEGWKVCRRNFLVLYSAVVFFILDPLIHLVQP